MRGRSQAKSLISTLLIYGVLSVLIASSSQDGLLIAAGVLAALVVAGVLYLERQERKTQRPSVGEPPSPSPPERDMWLS
jgi:uncharacterized membrane protein (UPF0136 family)